MLTLGVVLAVFQQWCGINVIFNCAEEILPHRRLRHLRRARQHRLDRSVNLAFTGACWGLSTASAAGH
ncbi:MAG: hypothetical protein U0736_16470 [Gemmataceae bacterium]